MVHHLLELRMEHRLLEHRLELRPLELRRLRTTRARRLASRFCHLRAGSRARALVVLLVLPLSLIPAGALDAIPYFARKYDVTCRQCHVTPPKLNSFGEAFRESGYRMPPGYQAGQTLPLAVWASGRSDALHDESEVSDAVRAYLNKLEVISGGEVLAPWLSYFVEWRLVSFEPQRRDGVVRLRDRSGRFEDIFLTAAADRLEVAVGQFRQINQVDVSLRLGLGEPMVLSSSLPGSDDGLARDDEGALTDAARRKLGLRGFSPSGRAPAVRIGWREPLPGGWGWTTSATLSAPGEFSIPLSEEARREASNELEMRLKGVFVESYLRRGLTSHGAHAFVDGDGRFLAQAVTTGRRGAVYWTGITGVARSAGVLNGRWSIQGEYIPRYFFAVGGRLEDRAGDGAGAAFLPFVNVHFPGTRHTFRLTAEHRVQRDNNVTSVELATIF